MQKTSERYVDVDVGQSKQADRHFRQGATWLAQGRVEGAIDALKRARDACPKGDVQAERKVEALLHVAEAERKKRQGREEASITHDEATVRTKDEAQDLPTDR